MLDINVTVDGDKVVIQGLERIASKIPGAVNRGLTRIGAGIYSHAYDWLSGPGAQGEYIGSRTGKKRWKKRDHAIPGGGYPVPVRTGHLRRMLNWLKPGETKSHGKVGTFSAGPLQVVIYNAAEYHNVIHEGILSSKKFGSRPYLTDALEKFNRADGIRRVIEEEIQKEIDLVVGDAHID